MIVLLIKLTVLLAAGWIGAALLRSRAAALRHLVWTATLAAAIGLAALAPLLPPLEIPLPGFRTLAAGQPGADPALREIQLASGTDERAVRGDSSSSPAATAPDAGPDSTAASRPTLRTLLLVAWLAGAIGIGAWWTLGCAGLARLAARARLVTAPDWRTLLDDAREAAGLRQEVALRYSADVGSPVVWGVRHPVVLLPENADDWSEGRRRAVLAHELAHVARNDGLVNSMATIAAALYWFHPLTWVALHRLRIESERACDDRVLARGATGVDYAAHLLEIARGARALRLAGLSAIGMARPTHLEGRLLAVLDEQRVRSEPRLLTRVLLVSALVLGVPLLAAARAVPLSPTDTTLRVASAGTKEPDSVVERTLEAAGGERLTLDLETGASVMVRGWREPQARVRVQLGGRDWQQTRVDISRVDNGVRVHTWMESRGTQSTSHAVEIMVPQRYDVQLHSAGGDLSLSDLEGSFEGTTGGGSLTLSKLEGDADLRTGGGDIRVSDSHLAGSVSSGAGRVELSHVSGGLRGTSGSGPVIYRDDAKSGKDGGKLHLSQAGGDIALDEITEGAFIETGGGDIRVRRSTGEVEASTGGGDIDIGHVSGSVQATTGAGTVSIQVDELARDGGGISVNTGVGTVVIELPADVAATFDLETAYTDNYGRKTRIEDDWSLPVTETDTWDDSHGTPRKYVRAKGQVGGGGPVVKVRATNGNISVIRR